MILTFLVHILFCINQNHIYIATSNWVIVFNEFKNNKIFKYDKKKYLKKLSNYNHHLCNDISFFNTIAYCEN
jgi:hypothetical protein